MADFLDHDVDSLSDAYQKIESMSADDFDELELLEFFLIVVDTDKNGEEVVDVSGTQQIDGLTNYNDIEDALLSINNNLDNNYTKTANLLDSLIGIASDDFVNITTGAEDLETVLNDIDTQIGNMPSENTLKSDVFDFPKSTSASGPTLITSWERWAVDTGDNKVTLKVDSDFSEGDVTKVLDEGGNANNNAIVIERDSSLPDFYYSNDLQSSITSAIANAIITLYHAGDKIIVNVSSSGEFYDIDSNDASVINTSAEIDSWSGEDYTYIDTLIRDMFDYIGSKDSGFDSLSSAINSLQNDLANVEESITNESDLRIVSLRRLSSDEGPYTVSDTSFSDGEQTGIFEKTKNESILRVAFDRLSTNGLIACGLQIDGDTHSTKHIKTRTGTKVVEFVLDSDVSKSIHDYSVGFVKNAGGDDEIENIILSMM